MQAIDLNEIREGRFLEELQQKISEAVGTAHARHDKVTVSVELVFTPKTMPPDNSEAVIISDRITVKEPKPELGSTSMYVHEGEAGPRISRKHPQQAGLFERGKVRSISGEKD